MVGISITMYFNYWVIVVGRVLFGVSAGAITCILPKYIEETVPAKQLGSLIALYKFNSTLGVFVAFMWGEYLPSDKDTWELEHTNKWRVIYFYFPASLYLLYLIALLFVLKEDSIKYLID